ncbi:MAG: response regulator [Gammaproteobacteria bacterium]|nr:response regulator [Gammaproteobacteria bacterium]
MKILLIDDSSMALNISSKLLEEAGHEIEKLNEPENALERLREFQPDLLICDVMMPNVNGFEVIRRVRADEQLSGLCIIMASAKAYEADRNKAKKLGADGYIVKPFTMEKFHSVMQSLHSMELSAWGVRGTLPAPQEGYIHYGGNTSCYSLELSPERYLVFDAGTGIKALGSALMKAGRTRITADVFITHPHWDHINAFPFFTPLYIPGNAVRVHGIAQDEIGFEDLMVAQMDGTYFPVTVREFGAHVTFHEIGEQNLSIDDVRISTIHLKHPGHCLGYRVDHRDRSFCYITDNEIYPEDSDFADEEFTHKLADFCRGANVLVHDCTYFDEEYASKLHWGHSALSEVCRLAHLAEVERLWIHHHDPEQDDDDIARKLDVCVSALQKLGSETVAVLPREGMTEAV